MFDKVKYFPLLSSSRESIINHRCYKKEQQTKQISQEDTIEKDQFVTVILVFYKSDIFFLYEFVNLRSGVKL